jgi:hypothetical protein
MRISAQGRSWLAVAVLSLGIANADYVTFLQSPGFVGRWDPNQAILAPSDKHRSFTWETSSNVVVDEVWLLSFTPGSGPERETKLAYGKSESVAPLEGHPTTAPAADRTPGFGQQPTATPTGGRFGRQVKDGTGTGLRELVGVYHPCRSFELPMGANKNCAVEKTETGGLVHIPYSDDAEWLGLDVPLFFQAAWDNGTSYSRAFIFSSSEVTARISPDPNIFYNAAPKHTEQGKPPGTPIESSPDPGSTDSRGKDPGGKATPTPVAAAVSGGGLSSGAVIGIAVACGVVGLLLVFALVWYLLRRRQQKKAIHPVDSSYSSGNRADELMAEKEAAADVDVAPHSPYSDEGGSAAGPSGAYQDGAAHGEALAAGAVAVAHPRHLQDPPRSFTPYSDRPSAGGAGAAAGTPSVHAASVAQTDEPHVSVPSATPGRATPRALTTPYAHLVEEGMTEEEIRRLEEEERQLDAAIEQAGRR